MNREHGFPREIGMAVIGGLGIGTVLMYLLDPGQGRRRRAVVRDRLLRSARGGVRAIGVVGDDMRNRAQGVAARMRDWFRGEPPSDDALARRVRARLGHAVRHPESVSVDADNARVILKGPVLADELAVVMQRVGSVPGVQEVEYCLEVQQELDDVQEAQKHVYSGDRPDRRSLWSPTTRFLIGAGGGAATVYGLRRADRIGAATALIGLGMLVRGLTNIELPQLVGLSRTHRAVDVNKALTIHAPVERVYEFWNQYENFPRFMRNVREVRMIDEQRSHWVVAGPLGIPVEWDAQITQRIPNELISWRTLAGSIIEHGGSVHFRSQADGSTTVEVVLSYDPLAGTLGHAVATLFGADPKSELDEDLMRMKMLLEKQAETRAEVSASMGQA